MRAFNEFLIKKYGNDEQDDPRYEG